MQCLDFNLGQRSIQVDRYKECQSFLFDPVELQLTGEASEERDKPRVTREFNLKDHPVLESAYLEFEKLKLNRLIFLARFAATLLIAFDAWMYSQTCKFDHEYSRVLVNRAPSPAGAAMIAMPFLLFFGINPRRLSGSLIAALFFLGEGILVWIARY